MLIWQIFIYNLFISGHGVGTLHPFLYPDTSCSMRGTITSALNIVHTIEMTVLLSVNSIMHVLSGILKMNCVLHNNITYKSMRSWSLQCLLFSQQLKLSDGFQEVQKYDSQTQISVYRPGVIPVSPTRICTKTERGRVCLSLSSYVLLVFPFPFPLPFPFPESPAFSGLASFLAGLAFFCCKNRKTEIV